MVASASFSLISHFFTIELLFSYMLFGFAIRCPSTFKLSILQENKWKVGWTLKTTLLTPLTIPPPKYGWIYHLLSRLPRKHKQYEVMISDYLPCNCMDFFSHDVCLLASEGYGCNVNINITFRNMPCCHNLSLGFMTKAKAWKGVDQKCNLRFTLTHLRVCESEGMSPHTPKWIPTLGVGNPMDYWIFRQQFERSKLIKLKSYLYHWKYLKT
jgi:hypothetical protein